MNYFVNTNYCLPFYSKKVLVVYTMKIEMVTIQEVLEVKFKKEDFLIMKKLSNKI